MSWVWILIIVQLIQPERKRVLSTIGQADLLPAGKIAP
jgi:hypothetical protein